ncbi:tetratricopeptide repeat protein [Streptomyces formicae]|uniref:Tetratricopeptide repeat protein n=1 Tax=Streptomyces formicae TaxID=1616117 RepID=A0ABY3WRY3_9ACTN|nr:hypothetical protein [Streptomyces formicae]UNM15404.1 hypothetical protein J4032_31600 [Streptomyces formicae]
MKTRYAPNIRNAAIGTVVAGGLVAGFLLFGPGAEGPPPDSGPAAQAMLTAGTGAPVSVGELSVLIEDRERWLRSHSDDDESWAVLGSAYVERGAARAEWAYFPKAESALKRSLAVRSGAKGNTAAELGMAALANARHDYTAAKRWGERVRARSPRQWAAYALLIDTYNGLGDLKSAHKALAKLEQLRPGVASALGRAALADRDRGRREDAATKAYEAMTRAGSPAEKAFTQYRLGELAWERGEPAEALAHYDAALRIDAGHHRSRAGRARALAGLGRTDEALSDYEAAVKAVPLPQYALEAGELYESLGIDGDARTHYDLMRREAAQARRNGVSEELVLARYEADHGGARSAVRRLEQEWRRGHRSVYVADALGWALHRAGRSAEGLKYAKAATHPGMRNALFVYHLGEIERARDMTGAARRHLAEALRINPKFSPLLAPKAAKILAELGEPPAGGPEDIWGEAEPWDLEGTPPPLETPLPSPSDDDEEEEEEEEYAEDAEDAEEERDEEGGEPRPDASDARGSERRGSERRGSERRASDEPGRSEASDVPHASKASEGSQAPEASPSER